MNDRTIANAPGAGAPPLRRSGRAAAGPARARLAGVAAVLAFLLVLPQLGAEKFALTVGIMVFITAIAAASLHLIIRTGHVSLAHAAFMGIGAYASVIATMTYKLPFWLAVIASFLAPAALALVIGPIVLRLTGKYFVLLTFMFGEIVRMVFVDWKTVTGGSNGIFGVQPPAPMFADTTAFYYLALAFAVVLIGGMARLLSSEIGRSIDAIREGERLAECSGVPVLRVKVTMFVLGCGIAGIAGALQGHFVRYIDPTSFSMIQSLNLVVINVLGGMYTLVGPLLGTLFLVVMPEMLRGYVELQRVFFGIIIIVVMAFFPGGMANIGVLFGRIFNKRTAKGGK